MKETRRTPPHWQGGVSKKKTEENEDEINKVEDTEELQKDTREDIKQPKTDQL